MTTCKNGFFRIVFYLSFSLIVIFVMIYSAHAADNPPSQGIKFPDKGFTNMIGMKFVPIPGGTFMMGSPPDELKRDSDERQCRVRLSKSFFLQTTEVTVREWRIFAQQTGYRTTAEKKGWAWIWDGKKWERKKGICWYLPGFPQTDMHPVTCISWDDARNFIKWLNKKDDRTYRLPTEAEWEYACRAGTTTPFYTGDCISTEEANYDGQYPMPGCSSGENRKKTLPVGSFQSNPWGLFDMHGNVWEWCQDWKGNYPDSSVISPEGALHGRRRVMRGGSWYNKAWYLRSADRSKGIPDVRTNYLGFRVAAGF
jgi:formylglycine-generating enzyme required for sulfatase activity